MENVARLLLQDVHFTYPEGTRALSNISLGVAAGDFIGILGYNGSGKTTLLNVMDGLNKDFQGTVLLDGADIRGLTPKEIYRKMGIVFQNPDDQLFASTVREDVAFGPINMGFSKKEVSRRVTAALRDIDMEECAGKSIHHLSFGQKKKICIAGLLSMGHEILLLDEPTAGLDPLGEYHMMSLLTKLNKEKGGHHRHRHPQRRSGPALHRPAVRLKRRGNRPQRAARVGLHGPGRDEGHQAPHAPYRGTHVPAETRRPAAVPERSAHDRRGQAGIIASL